MTDSPRAQSNIIPTLRYKDAAAAIDWLMAAFGFEEHLIVRDEESGNIRHAQLGYGNGMIMLGSDADDEFGQLQRAPVSPAGPVPQSAYIVVVDIEAHYERALAAGAVIAMPLKTEDYGGKSYSCWDPEGQLWNFGSYDPWADNPA